MVLSDARKIEYTKRLLKSRMRVLCNQAFYGLLLMHLKFFLDERVESADTDGKGIFLNPYFLDSINDRDLDYLLIELIQKILQKILNPDEKDEDQDEKDEDQDQKDEDQDQKDEGQDQKDEGQEQKDKDRDHEDEDRNQKDEDKKKIKEFSDKNQPEQSGDDDFDRDLWEKYVADAVEAVMSRVNNGGTGTVPTSVERQVRELKKPQTDWRTILNNFIQEDITDYSFTPPDRRFDDADFFLPDFNEKEDRIRNILFMIDTSGSMSDEMITAAYSEIKGAFDQFDGKVGGWLGFFDAAVTEPKPFASEDEFKIIRPKGGGGTSFEVIFEYVQQQMQDDLPTSIIILTDGFAAFPDEEMSMGIPVLWLLNNTEVDPPWGKVTRITR